MHIRSMTLSDVPQVAHLEAMIAPSPWTPALFDEEIGLGGYCRLLEGPSGRVLGYSVARLQVDEWHLLTLGIAPDFRRQGGARRLLDDLIQHATTRGDREILLEVRASNLPARTLYQERGFQFLYMRKGYYRLEAGSEDALLLSRRLAGMEA